MLNRIYYIIGRVFETKKKWELALNFYLKIPYNSKVNYRTAFCYKKRKDYGNAIFFFKQAISRQDDKVHWYLNLIEVLLILKREEEAIDYLKQSLKLKINNKNKKRVALFRKKIQQGIQELDTFVDTIEMVDSEYLKIDIVGDMNNFNSESLQLEFTNRKNGLDILSSSYLVDFSSIKIDENGLFRAIAMISLKKFQIENEVINYTWDFYIKSNKKKIALKYFEKINSLIKYQNIDLIPYQTKSRTLAILSIRKESKFIDSKKTDITLVISRVDEEAFFIKNTITLANILVSLDYNVTILSLDLKVNSNKFAISPKVNFDYISTSMLYHSDKNIDFTSSDIIPSEEYIEKLNEYLLKIDTDILYTPIFGDFILNQILNITSGSTLKIVAEYNKRRYNTYIKLLETEDEISIDTITDRVQTKHFFDNIDLISAVHIIYPEAKPLFREITDKPIIATFSNEESIIQEWKSHLPKLDNNKEEEDLLFY